MIILLILWSVVMNLHILADKNRSLSWIFMMLTCLIFICLPHNSFLRDRKPEWDRVGETVIWCQRLGLLSHSLMTNLRSFLLPNDKLRRQECGRKLIMWESTSMGRSCRSFVWLECWRVWSPPLSVWKCAPCNQMEIRNGCLVGRGDHRSTW